MLTGYVTAKDAAQQAGLEYHTFLARMRKGWVPHEKHGRAILIKQTDLNRVLHADRPDMGATGAREVVLSIHEDKIG